MARRGRKGKKHKHIRELSSDEAGPVLFEDESKAHELLEDFLDNHFDPEHSEVEQTQKSRPNLAKKKKNAANVKKISLDLHGKTLEESEALIQETVDHARTSGLREIDLHIITGKGLHSGPSGGVLAKEVHRYVTHRFFKYISRIEDSPDQVKLGGIPIRGHFTVRMRFNS